MPRTIFMSYTSLCNNLVNGNISTRELKDKYFYFGCMKSHVFRDLKQDMGEYQYFCNDLEKIHKINEELKVEILKAERDGRIVWKNSKKEDEESLIEFCKMIGSHALEEEIQYSYRMNDNFLGRYSLKELVEEYTDFYCFI